MKYLILIVLNFISIISFPQKSNETIIGDIAINDTIDNKFIKLLIEYENECISDTIKAIQYEDGFIIDHKYYVTIEQLNKTGYVYSYRWLINTEPFVFEYYFIRELTLKGFLQWLKKKYN